MHDLLFKSSIYLCLSIQEHIQNDSRCVYHIRHLDGTCSVKPTSVQNGTLSKLNHGTKFVSRMFVFSKRSHVIGGIRIWGRGVMKIVQIRINHSGPFNFEYL